MSENRKKSSKIESFMDNCEFLSLDSDVREFLEKKADEYTLSFQDIKKLIDFARDLEMWGEPDLIRFWDDSKAEGFKGRERKRHILSDIEKKRSLLISTPKDYSGFSPDNKDYPDLSCVSGHRDGPILGKCPVASPKTRCCNLTTLDAVINCGFACSYCSIQGFYDGNRIFFHDDLAAKLQEVDIDPEEIYHIGTGQSSDSLMWGNKNGLLDDLFDFADKNCNVVLELKSKSANINRLLNGKVPGNVIATWSLNTPVIIENEELLAASLDDRLKAARAAADKGILVGFHFHPMVYYKGWKEDYSKIFDRLKAEFSPEEVAMVSFGTLTFIKPVLKQLRRRGLKSKILQMPLEDASGKFSYPLDIKEEMFTHAYSSLKEWSPEVFFYMCMEDISLWKPVFGYEYSDNDEFESAMKNAYIKKIQYNIQKNR